MKSSHMRIKCQHLLYLEGIIILELRSKALTSRSPMNEAEHANF